MPSELEQFRAEVTDWLQENRPSKPDFLLPETFMEVGSDEQFHYLRDWQRQVYEAGYLGMAWPSEYGGCGKPQAFQGAERDSNTGVCWSALRRHHLHSRRIPLCEVDRANVVAPTIGNAGDYPDWMLCN